MKRYLAGLVLCAHALLLAPSALGQAFTASADRTVVRLGESLVLRLSVSGVSKSPAPTLPALPAFEIQPLGPTRHVELFDSRLSSEIRFHYRLTPRETGEHQIGPATVEIAGRRLESEPFVVRVLAADAPAQRGGHAGDELFVTAWVSTREPYVGQQVIYRWRVWKRVRLEAVSLSGPFQFPGVLVEDLGDVRRFEEVHNGHLYRVQEISKALFPRRAGRVVLTAPELHAEVLRRRRSFSDVFGRLETEKLVLPSPEPVLEVRPLPSPPAAFSGLVGRFEIDARLSRSELMVGESATLEVTVSGRGNVRGVPPPALRLPPELKVYEEPAEVSLNRREEGLSGRKRFVRALVPLRPGEHRLDPISLVYFDPGAEAYRTASSPALELRIEPGPESANAASSESPTAESKLAVRVADDQIRPLYRALDAVDSGLAGRLGIGGVLGAALLPPLAYLALWLFLRRRRRYQTDRALERRHRARARALARLAEVEELEAAGDLRAAALAAYRLLRSYVGDKVDQTGGALTPQEAASHLSRAGVTGDAVRRLQDFLEQLEAAGYGGMSSLPGLGGQTGLPGAAHADGAAGLAARTRDELEILDREVRRAEKA